MNNAILVNKKVVKMSLLSPAYAEFWNNPKNKIVKQDEVDPNFLVSTVFLCSNHGFLPNEELWFETMVVKKDEWGKINFSDLYCERYETYEAAESGHKSIVNKLLNGTLELLG